MGGLLVQSENDECVSKETYEKNSRFIMSYLLIDANKFSIKLNFMTFNPMSINLLKLKTF